MKRWTKIRLNRQKGLHNKLKRDKAKNQKWLRKLKGAAGCRSCGECDPEVLDFHHPPDELKLFTISQSYHKSRDVLFAEVAKCHILCANCHRRLHGQLRLKRKNLRQGVLTPLAPK